MYDVASLIVKVETFVTAAETAAVDASEKGEAFLRETADWIAATRQKLVASQATPEQEQKCNQLIERCYKVCPSSDPDKHFPKGFGLPGNPILTLLFQFVTQLLTTLVVTPPAPKTT